MGVQYMTIHDYILKIEVAENQMNNAETAEELEIAMEKINIARKELNLFIREMKQKIQKAC